MSFGLLLAAGLLWVLLRGTDWEEFRAALMRVSWGWLLVAQAVAWTSYFTRVKRWSYVVRAAQPASFRHLLSATQIGFFVNFTVPARIGELVRAYLLSRFTRQSLARSISMVTVDRINDFIGLLVVMTVALFAYDIDRDVEIAAGTFGNTAPIGISSGVIRPAILVLSGLLVTAATVLAVLRLRQSIIIRFTHALLDRVSTNLAKRVVGILRSFAEGLNVFQSSRDLTKVMFWTLVTWGANAISLAAIMLAFGFPSPWAAAFLMLTFIALSISLPVAPGVVGQYHLPVVAALMLSYQGMEPAHAKAVAVVSHLSMLIPIGGLGLYCLKREGMDFLGVVRTSQRANTDVLVNPPKPTTEEIR